MLKEIKGTVVNGVTCPTLEELQTRECSLQELQAALVQLIDVVNRNARVDSKPLEFNM